MTLDSLDPVLEDDLDVTAAHRPLALSLLALALGGFGIGTTEFATMGVLPDIASGVHVSIPTAGHLISAYALGVVVGAPLLAVATAKLPRKLVLLLLMVAFALGNLGSTVAPGYHSLLLARFASGLPHGAYFGIAAVVAASLVPVSRRGWSVSMVMTGLTIANLAGVPLSTLLGQHLGWRAAFAVVAGIGVLTVAAIAYAVPPVPVVDGASPARELTALRSPQVLLTLLTGSVGFGGFFAVYSYITPTLTKVTGYEEAAVPVVLALFGLGMTLGNLAGGRLADWSVDRTVALGLVAFIVALLVFTQAAHYVVPAALDVVLIGGIGSATIPALQMRLMDVAGDDAQALAAASNHSALNIANALGAWLGGVVIAAGHGYTAPAVVGAGLAVLGLAVHGGAVLVGRRAAV
ncbi:DHA1 family inner membrane transport protein [Motilibacter rhizosphaerae]|uniref:DHA1 family inner membrane transport protein n=1 Tax=Motilibacter rhizosphaerae TaxID=598652 RepID=A0A4Q7NQM8_9ACTN|nr:MFS transporter [Motilibacter rhizosphaerae]RZS87533.1 DHA1 family inner membrane transport protein [Motilibacter rhizosphaerae]